MRMVAVVGLKRREVRLVLSVVLRVVLRMRVVVLGVPGRSIVTRVVAQLWHSTAADDGGAWV